MFGKDWDWWLGKNSFWHHVGGERILIGALGGTASYPPSTPRGGGEAEWLKYGFIGLGVYVIVKAMK